MPLLELPHIHIEYSEHGDPSGTPVLLLHGFPDAADAWEPLLAVWSGPPARFIVPSLRGFGQTEICSEDARTGEIAALADDAVQLLDALRIDKALIVGHDWGSRAAYAAAALWPARVRAVIALASEYISHKNSGVLPHEQERDYWYQWFFHTPQGEQALARDRKGLCGYLWEVWSPTWRFSSGELDRAAIAWKNLQFVSTVISYYRNRYGNMPGAPRYADSAARLAEKPPIPVPTWFLTGLADACNHSKGSIGQESWFTGGYNRVELPEIGHFIPRQAPGAVTAAISEALEQIPQAAPKQGLLG